MVIGGVALLHAKSQSPHLAMPVRVFRSSNTLFILVGFSIWVSSPGPLESTRGVISRPVLPGHPGKMFEVTRSQNGAIELEPVHHICGSPFLQRQTHLNRSHGIMNFAETA